MLKSARGVGKKTLSVLLAVLLFASVAPLSGITVFAAAEDDGLVYGEIVFTDTIESGSGVEPTTETDTLYGVLEYQGDKKFVTVPSSKDGRVVEYIGDYAFSGTAVESVSLPDTIRGIGKGAFMDCVYLNRVVIGNNKDVNNFGDFNDYPVLKKKLKGTLETNAFAGCGSLRHFAVFTAAASPVPNTINFTAANVFAGCGKLTFYGWGDNNMVKLYYDSVFPPVADWSYINLEEVINSVSGVTVNPTNAFMAKGETLALTVSISPFNASFLYNIYSFSSSDSSVVTVNDEGVITAVGNGVARITVSSINGYDAYCDITVAERVEGNYGYRFLADGTVEIEKFASDVTGAVIVPAAIAGKKVTSIGDGAFSGCSGITSLTLPDSVKRIGVGAFLNCTGLALLNISAASSLKSIGNSAFYGCSSLAFINIECALETIGDAAFRNCSSLSAVILPASFQELGKDAFLGDDALSIFSVTDNTNISLQTSIVYFSPNAPLTIYANADTSAQTYASSKNINFVSDVDDVSEITWTNLTSTLIVGESAALSVDSVVSGAPQTDYNKVAFVSDNNGVINVDVNTVNAVGAGTARVYAIAPNGKVVSTVITVKRGVSGDYEYKLIGNMTEAEIMGFTNAFAEETAVPDTVVFKGTPVPVTAVSSGAFSDAASLKRIAIGAFVSSLNGSAFDMAYALEEITVSDENAYYSDNGGILFNAAKTALLKYPAAKKGGTYKVPSGITSIGDYAFKDNNNLTNITLSQTLVKIGSHSFENMNRLLGVNLPATVSSIGAFAFAYNSALDYILIPKAVSAIGEGAFFGSDLTIFGYEGYYGKTYADLNSISFKNAALLVEVGELRLSASLVTLKITDIYTLDVSVLPASASYPVYFFQSSDPEIATVDAYGVITALKKGETVVTVSSSRGVYALCTVVVSDDSSGTPGDPNMVTSINIALEPDKKIYENGESLDFTGASIYAVYSDETTRVKIIDENGNISSGVRIRNYDAYKAGAQTVEIIYGDASASFTVTVLERRLTGIQITALPAKLIYIEGSQLENAGLVVTAFYNNGQTEPVYDYTVSAVPAVLGIHPITVSYGGFTDVFNVTVVKKTLVSVDITPPAKTSYVQGDDFDLTGFTAVAYYDNGTSRALGEESFSFAGINTNIIGNQQIDAIYSEGGVTITKSFYITVTPRTLKEIQIVSQPDKQVYILGETLDITGFEVVAVYDNSTYEYLSPTYLFEFENIVLSLGDNYITVQYTENEITCTATFKVFVELGNYNGEFTYKINGGAIEIYKFSSALSGAYTIPETVGGYPVKTISNSAFRNNSTVTSIAIPNSVTSIGIGAFENCGSLTSVSIGDGITKIPDNAFYKCKSLKSVILPSSVIEIGQLAFARCDALAFVSVPSSVKKISADAFDYNSEDFKVIAPSGSAAHNLAVSRGIKWEAPNLISGDVNGNGTIEVNDARLALRGAVGLETLDAQAEIRADYNKNGTVGVDDARLILRKAVGLD